MQAVCDSDGHFLEVWIKNPALSSDFISFVCSNYYKKLADKSKDFLCPDLRLFGNNAYVQMKFMMVPYKGVESRQIDDFNFFHSQVCIVL